MQRERSVHDLPVVTVTTINAKNKQTKNKEDRLLNGTGAEEKGRQ